MLALGYSLPIAGVSSSYANAASRTPLFFSGFSFLGLDVSASTESVALIGRVALGAIFSVEAL